VVSLSLTARTSSGNSSGRRGACFASTAAFCRLLEMEATTFT
jgi:hypothetical protein